MNEVNRIGKRPWRERWYRDKRPHMTGDNIIHQIAAGLARHKLVPFFGAGVSAGQLQILWQDISDEMADAANVPAGVRGDPLKVADEYVNAKGGEALAELLRARLIVPHFDDVKGWAHLFLLSLSAGVLYTTNQDNLFELASSKKGRTHRVVARIEDLAESDPGDRLLIKYHGDLSHPETVIFTGTSYQTRIADKDHFLNIRMRADLLAKGFLFVGYSFNDPNIRLLFKELRTAFGDRLPASYLIAYRYDPSMEDLHCEFGVTIVDPASRYPGKAAGEAFTLYLKALSEEVLKLKSRGELSNLLAPVTPSSARVATEFDVATVLSAAQAGNFAEGLKTYRALLDRTVIPDDLAEDALAAFKALCDAARTNEDLIAISAAVFNLSLPNAQALQAISRFMVAINRIDDTRNFPSFMVVSPAHGDSMIPMAAAFAAAEIRENGEGINDAFRVYADAWMMAFPKLPPEIQGVVRSSVESAWEGKGAVPAHLFDRKGPFNSKTFDEIASELRDLVPRKLRHPES